MKISLAVAATLLAAGMTAAAADEDFNVALADNGRRDGDIWEFRAPVGFIKR